MTSFDRSAYLYTSFFCEENIWWLVNTLIEQGVDAEGLEVWLLSNARKCNLLFSQRSTDGDEPVCWDYHVVLSAALDGDKVVFDFDTRLPFPVARDIYLRQTFAGQSQLHPSLRTRVRRIPAENYISRFSSDRSHMVGKLPTASFPTYTPISPAAPSRAIPLQAYWDLDRDLDDGSRVQSLDDLLK